jgi:transcriptional regulator with XRE-family HTH domain
MGEKHAHPANALAELMRAAGLNDPALAGLVGTSKQQIFKLRTGAVQLRREWAERLAPQLGVDWQYLMGWDSVPSSGSPITASHEPSARLAPRPELRALMKAIGIRIRFVRTARMVADLPEVAASMFGWSVQDLHAYENGEKTIPVESVVAFCGKFVVSADYLLLGHEDRLDDYLRARLRDLRGRS